ncbi:MAG: hypothetical protein B6D72_15840 [gamma proteobacterium symbiont of Ctena orbiculata]|uniref:DUF427 domain-containing protein n=1 Tax=Candidatus Thiodiazotropha taylori TaxID=2792791 RepID=A0A944M807_9GAMM|nr:DUF427 domain-containing protein [Candidatus Thiodiazotropha taylori]PUB79735.1 MAG: hypothetical protein DBP02_21805 [gamma proteobacterium symbiont of Ctena orbiculata]MBT2988873.1 DUF427 domain-containing protein [Candidatus Thiodiazotropha taylori]MBT2996481.1 DUF427 domain-containing protein [Candidatus Thiodiazotropha taylori]MBT3000085.1 DUF427 domain-containing protein [Candidatus Thiodiazotropha taylori]
MKAIWNGRIIAASDETLIVEGNHYFPPDSLHRDYFRSSSTTSICPWKGTANYYTISVDGRENRDAAWYYPSPSAAAEKIRDYVAFWRGVEIIE